jgi:hypothetical protein
VQEELEAAKAFAIRADAILLERCFPSAGVLSEGERDNFDGLSRSRVWIVDP